ncbi:hypothetical protein G9A89_002145 [Geosiphon pyriformis]|nr:hypothetical protein G9A89_002145 [Geosiphon pyriformis]
METINAAKIAKMLGRDPPKYGALLSTTKEQEKLKIHHVLEDHKFLATTKNIYWHSSESSVKIIANDLDTLVTKKFITFISKTYPSNCLDETFGFHLNRSQYSNIKTFLYHIAFCFEVLFIVKNGKDVKWLYIPSVAILASTLGINFGLAFFITTWESHFNIDVYKRQLLAAIDIEALSILSSRFAGLNFFSASYSETTKTWILWGSVLGLVMKAIPQFLVQVLYRKNVVTWDIIPLITLILSALLQITNLARYENLLWEGLRIELDIVLEYDKRAAEDFASAELVKLDDEQRFASTKLCGFMSDRFALSVSR